MGSVTPSSVAGDHLGALSLSTITARTPSAKSWLTTMRAAMRISMAISSAKSVMAAPARIWRRATFMERGDLVLSVTSCACAQSEPSAARAAKIASTVSWAKSESIWSRWAARVTRPGSRSSSVRISSMSSGSARIAAFRAAVSLDSTTSVVMPRSSQSAAFRRAPVRASHVPVAPCSLGRYQPPPTSGKRPMPVSGMAKAVRSVPMR